MKKTLFLTFLGIVFSVYSIYAQTTNDTVIIAWKLKNLTQQQEAMFDTLQLQIFNLDEVKYFKRVTPHYTTWDNLYHIKCDENADTIFSQLLRSNLFDTIFYDRVALSECSNPITTNDTYSNDYVVEMLELGCAWSITTGDPNLTVGIIDADFQNNLHSDLSGKVVNYYETGDYVGTGYCKPGIVPVPGFNDYHGLNMAGIISAIPNNSTGICGAGYNTKVNLYDYATAGSLNYHSEITSAIDFAAYNGEKVVNLSLKYCAGAEEYDNFVGFHTWLLGYGMNIVYSGGNDRSDLVSNYAELYEDIYQLPGVIIVGSVNDENETYISAVDYANHTCAHFIDICAPGYGITTTHYDGTIGETYLTDASGTSCSAAFVSSALALMLSVDSSLTPAQLEEILLTSTDSISDFNDANNYTNTVFGEDYTAGRLNTYHAVYKALNYTNCATSHIGSTEQLTWNIENFICDQLTIDGQLTITAPVHFLSNLAEIEINDGGSLIIDNGGELIHWEDEYFYGKIIVNPGGTLEIKNGGELDISHYGYIDVLAGTSQNGELIFNQGAAIELLDENTLLNFAGDLTIANNATFTFTGDGYVKFSNSGVDATYNITAGTGASMLFSGNGQTDKVLEVQQNTVHFPQLSSLTFENCKIVMGTSKRMQADAPYPVTFNNVKVTSSTSSNNNHRSFLFSGQSNVTINNSVFEYGQYGIHGNLTWTNGAPLYITNSTFRYNTQGINIYGKGLHLDNCVIIDNTTYGVYCNGMSFSSAFENCYFVSNNDGLCYNGTTSSDVNIDDTYFVFNYNDAIKTSGGFNCNLNCSYIMENSRYGVYSTNGTRINPFKCDMSNNLKTIYLNYGTVSLNAKYNQLQALNNGFTIFGYSPARATCGTNTYQSCNNNRWESNPNVAPLYNSNFKLWVYACPSVPQPTIIYLTDINRQYQTCESKISEEDLLEIESFNKLLNTELSQKNESANKEINYFDHETINYSSLIIDEIDSYNLQLNTLGTVTGTVITEKYNYIQELIADYYLTIGSEEYNVTFIETANEIIDFMNALAARNNISELDYYTIKLDIALLNRLQGKFDLSIDQLNTLSFYTEQNIVLIDSEYEYIQRWLCIINAEKSAKEGLLTIDEFNFAIEECEHCMTTKSDGIIENHSDTELFEKTSNSSKTTNNAPLSISPNPNNGNFNIFIDNPCNSCEIKIVNSIGQTVRSFKPAENGLQKINVEGFNSGYYKVVYSITNKVIDTRSVIVE